jgi:hypothetical protein
MGSSSSVPESPRPLYALVYAPWHVDAPELLLHWKKCIEVRGLRLGGCAPHTPTRGWGVWGACPPLGTNASRFLGGMGGLPPNRTTTASPTLK